MEIAKKRQRLKKPRLYAYIVLGLLPLISTITFYLLRANTQVMDIVSTGISAKIRSFLGLLTSVFPFSVMETAGTALGAGVIYYIVRTIIKAVREKEKRVLFITKRAAALIIVFLYFWSAFCWLWNSGYAGSGFAKRAGIDSAGSTTAELSAVTRLFAEKANALSSQVTRSADGHYAEDRHEYFAASADIYKNLVTQYPHLTGGQYRPKPMLYSWLMSRTGYTGIYFALTGEANININAPGCLIPATVAHELAHQRGVFAEDEANFVAIAACITSENTIFEYSGYLSGLIHLQNALYFADNSVWLEIQSTYTDELRQDLTDLSDYWTSQKTVDTGVEVFDEIMTSVTETVNDAVNTFYDGFLKSQGQELGLVSYGKCVDLLVAYYRVTG